MLALFHSFTGQMTQFMDAKQCLEFPTDTSIHYWYQDKQGNKYSFFEAMSKFYN